MLTGRAQFSEPLAPGEMRFPGSAVPPVAVAAETMIHLFLDPLGVVQSIDRSGVACLGWPAAVLSGRSFYDLLVPEDRVAVRAELSQLLERDEPSWRLEIRLLAQNAAPVRVKARFQSLLGASGVTGILVACQVLTASGPAVQLSAGAVQFSSHQVESEMPQPSRILQTTLDCLPLAIFVKDARPEHFGKFRLWNHTSEQLFGFTAEQLLGHTIDQLLPEEQVKLLTASDRLALTQQQVEILSQAVVAHTRSPDRICRIRKILIRDANQQPLYILGIAEDVTEHRRIEESLSQQAEREKLIAAIVQRIRQFLDLDKILTTTVDEVRAFLQVDRVLIFRFEPTWAGTVLVESVGEPWQAILGQTIEDPCFTRGYVPKYQQGHVQVVNDLDHAGLSPCYRTMLAAYQVRAVLVVPILQADRLWGLLIAHHCSETRQWQSQEVELLKQLATQLSIAIQQSELYQQVQSLNMGLEKQVQAHAAQLQLAFEFEATLKRITDRVRDSLDEEQILQTAVTELALAIGVSSCNAAIYDLEQRTSMVRYEYTTSLMPFQGRIVQMNNFWEGYQQLLQGQYFQFCSLLPNPVRGRVAMLACPIVDDQGVLGDLWLVKQNDQVFNDQDIRLVQQVANQGAIALRQARLYQEAQIQVQALEKLNRLKDDFLSTVSHELRTPMTNIKLATQMLEIMLRREQLLTTPSSPISQYFQILRDECQREIGLINDLLDLSRLEAGTEPPVLSPIALQDWFPRAIAPFRERIQEQQQFLSLEIPADLPLLTTDESYLERIVSELLNNACKYTPAQGQIRVRAGVVSGTASAGVQRWLQFRVSNSGIEISAEELSQIFNKFYRIPNNDPWKHGGTGLGLALVKRLIEILGGAIHVTSQAGITCFTVELPLET